MKSKIAIMTMAAVGLTALVLTGCAKKETPAPAAPAETAAPAAPAETNAAAPAAATP